MHDFVLTPIACAIGIVYGLWTETPQAISPWVLKQIRNPNIKNLKHVYEESWDKPILKIKGE